MPSPAVPLLSATCIALALMLGGCGKAVEQPATKAAGAQVLPGTISDAMLDVDRSQAQPLLQPAPHTKAAAIDTPTDDASDAVADAPDRPEAPPN